MQSLYQLSKEFEFLINKEEYDVDDLERIDSLPGEIEDKLINYGRVIKNLEALDSAMDKEIRAMRDRRTKLLIKISLLNNAIKRAMNALDLKKIVSPNFDITRKLNPPRMIINEKLLPKTYYQRLPEEYEIDKDLIKFDLDKGIEVPGVAFEQGERVEIK